LNDDRRPVITTTVATPSAHGITWKNFGRRLARTLREMPDRTFLIVASKGGGPERYVQFAQDASSGLRAEAVASGSLAADEALSPWQDLALVDLGWQPPEKREGAGPNYFRQVDGPMPRQEVAGLAVRTLRDVFGINEPAALEYSHGSFEREEVLQADLGIDVRPQTQEPAPDRHSEAISGELAAFIASTLEGWLGKEKVAREGGACVIWIRPDPIVVRVLDGSTPMVRIVTPIFHDVEEDRILPALNEINGEIRFGRVFRTSRQVSVAVELSAVDIAADLIVFACSSLSDLADEIDADLHRRLGGVTLLGTNAPVVN
jgi:hypothetical protein